MGPPSFYGRSPQPISGGDLPKKPAAQEAVSLFPEESRHGGRDREQNQDPADGDAEEEPRGEQKKKRDDIQGHPHEPDPWRVQHSARHSLPGHQNPAHVVRVSQIAFDMRTRDPPAIVMTP